MQSKHVLSFWVRLGPTTWPSLLDPKPRVCTWVGLRPYPLWLGRQMAQSLFLRSPTQPHRLGWNEGSTSNQETRPNFFFSVIEKKKYSSCYHASGFTQEREEVTLAWGVLVASWWSCQGCWRFTVEASGVAFLGGLMWLLKKREREAMELVVQNNSW